MTTAGRLGLTRRDLLHGMGGLAAALAAPPLLRAAGGPRPNILFILTDDQRYDAMSCIGHPAWLKTPGMDRIRKEGVLFANAFDTTSLCSPARASFLTGCYAHRHGVTGNKGTEFDHDKTPSFPRVLREAGYETAFIGKWHMAPTAQPRPGFDYWFSFKGQGEYVNPALNDNGHDFKADGYMTDILNAKALEFLRKPHKKPFCLYLSHKAVHGPFTPAERHKNLYAGEELPQPESWNDTLEGKPKWQRAASQAGGRKDGKQKGKSKSAPPANDKILDALAPRAWDGAGKLNYYRTLAAVDEGVEKILDLLKETGRLDNTVILFAGDNGYFHGEHRRGDKRLAYEESMRIPLVMRYPPLARPGGTIKEMVLNIDVAPTVLDLAGAPVPDTVQGRSVRPLLEGKPEGWRRSFLYSYWVDLNPSIPRMIGVRTDTWKYVCYPDIDDLDELYDLAGDPKEMKNLSQDPAHAVKRKELIEEMGRLMKETGYVNPAGPAPAKQKQAAGLLLEYDFSAVRGGTIPDASGHGNDGKASQPRIVPGRNGKGKAMQFAGDDAIELPKGDRLDPSDSPWAVEVWIRPEAAEGVVLAHGGASLGYMLFLDGGRPCFGVRADKGALRVARSDQACTDKWTHVVGVIDGNKAALYVNGRSADVADIPGPIDKNPNDALTIGMDKGSQIDEKISSKGFKGLIGSVKVHRQALTEEEVRREAGT